MSKSRVLTALFCLAVGASHAPLRAAETDGPQAPFDLSDQIRITAGKKRFGANCAAYCHGSEGEGGKTPRFKGNKNFMPADAFKTITEGRKGSDVMPPWGNTFTPEQIWELVAYIDSLAKQPAPE